MNEPQKKYGWMPVAKDYAEPISTEKKGGEEKCHTQSDATVQAVEQTESVGSPGPGVNQQPAAPGPQSNIMEILEKARRVYSDYKYALECVEYIKTSIEVEATKATPPPWQRITETCLPEANRPMWLYQDQTKTYCCATTGVENPWLNINKAWTHWMPCEGIYQIPPPPVEEKPSDGYKEWCDANDCLTYALQHDVWLAALRAAKTNPKLLDNL